MQLVLADVAVSVSELKKNPSSVMNGANGSAVAERLDELELVQLVKERLDAKEAPIRVSLDELIAEAEADIANGH
ncbi:antitoxin [Pseudomonas sp. WP001]|nr:antitoxin [Pseudomonas sp. WP001]